VSVCPNPRTLSARPNPNKLRRIGLFLLLLLALPITALAHVGSKDVFEQVQAGPYTLFVTVRMPNVIPGVAEVEVRANGPAVTAIDITPLPLTGEASKHPPTADAMKRSDSDPNFFTGAVWMMAPGSWQVRLRAAGAAGTGTASVPVPAVALATLPMERNMALMLAALGLFLFVSMGGVVAAAVREARLPAGATPTPSLRRRGLLAMGGSLVVMGLIVYGGALWWKVDAAVFTHDLYRPLKVDATLTGNRLDLRVKPFHADDDRRARANDDFLPDHGHLIHLYAIRWPQMDAVFHLHPSFDGHGDFSMTLPAMPPGEYALYGDVVHANGFPETLVTRLEVPMSTLGGPLAPDDASGFPPPVSAGQPSATYTLPDGYRMVWARPATLTANTAYAFHFSLLAPDGQPAADMRPYLGMTGHAAFVKTDGTVFAHTHPEGSAAMASLMLANGAMEDAMGQMQPISNQVDFPYGFPSPGPYRILVQMKHGATVETGVFDATVSPSK
jgi:hypothetical protein